MLTYFVRDTLLGSRHSEFGGVKKYFNNKLCFFTASSSRQGKWLTRNSSSSSSTLSLYDDHDRVRVPSV